MNSERINFTCAKIVIDELNFLFWSSKYYELDSTDETKNDLVSYVTRYPAPLIQDMLQWINSQSMKGGFREEITWNGIDPYVHEKILTQLNVLKSLKKQHHVSKKALNAHERLRSFLENNTPTIE
jgi:hypothetical protein